MSHFSVFVTVPQMNPAAPIHVDELEDRVATILARYDEQTEVDEYREFEDRTDEARADYEKDTVKVVQFQDGAIHSIYDRAFRDRFYLSEDSTICEYGPNHDTESKLVTDASKALKLIPDYPVKQLYESPCYNCIDIMDLALHRPNAETEFANFEPAEEGSQE